MISAHELWYDYKFGVRTGFILPVSQLDIENEARLHANDYFPSSYLFVQEALAAVPASLRGRVFVDFGCGMGRVLLFASTLPFSRVIGVEISPSLAAIANQNLEHYYKTSGKSSPSWDVVALDARRFEIPSDATVFYLFNPFDAVVLGEVADRIIASLQRSLRDCFVVYAKPVHEVILTDRGFVHLPPSTADFSLLSYAGHR
jgi:predicted RNA methylase